MYIVVNIYGYIIIQSNFTGLFNTGWLQQKTILLGKYDFVWQDLAMIPELNISIFSVKTLNHFKVRGRLVTRSQRFILKYKLFPIIGLCLKDG